MAWLPNDGVVNRARLFVRSERFVDHAWGPIPEVGSSRWSTSGLWNNCLRRPTRAGDSPFDNSLAGLSLTSDDRAALQPYSNALVNSRTRQSLRLPTKAKLFRPCAFGIQKAAHFQAKYPIRF